MKKYGVGVLALLGIVVIFIVVGSTNKTPVEDSTASVQADSSLKTGDVKEVVTEVEETKEEGQFLSSLDPTLLNTEDGDLVLRHFEKDLNALAVGFVTMSAFLDMPESITNHEEMQAEFELSVGQYATIFDKFGQYEGNTLQKELITKMNDRYRLLFDMRKFQMDNLKQVDGLTVIDYTTDNVKGYTEEMINVHWQEVVAMHKDYTVVTGLDYTGGLGALMK